MNPDDLTKTHTESQERDERLQKMLNRLTEGDLTISTPAELVEHIETMLSEEGYMEGDFELESIVELINRIHAGNDTRDKVSFTVKSRGRLVDHLELDLDDTHPTEKP